MHHLSALSMSVLTVGIEPCVASTQQLLDDWLLSVRLCLCFLDFGRWSWQWYGPKSIHIRHIEFKVRVNLLDV